MKFTTKAGAVYLRVQKKGQLYLTRKTVDGLPETDDFGPLWPNLIYSWRGTIVNELVIWEDHLPIVGLRYGCYMKDFGPLWTTNVESIDEL